MWRTFYLYDSSLVRHKALLSNKVEVDLDANLLNFKKHSQRINKDNI